MIREFKDSKFIDKKLKLVVTSLNGQQELWDDFGGVLRDILSAFWSGLFKGHATGDTEMVPYLHHEFGATERAAIARIIVKGYNDVGYYPITINKAFMVSYVFGEQAVSEEMLFRSFLNFITYEERQTVKCSLSKDILDLDAGGTDEDILEILSNFNCKRLARNGKKLKELLTEVAHKELMQTPCYMREVFETVFLYTKFIKDLDEMEQIYNQLIPSCKKVLKILKPDIRDLHERTSYDFLKKFIRSLKDGELRSFLRYCTGADVMCFEKIEVTFSNLKGAQRRVIAHTCGPMIEVPATYESYCEFKEEFLNILKNRYWNMDIV